MWVPMPRALYPVQGRAIRPPGLSLKNNPVLREVLLHAFNVLRTELLSPTPYIELSKNQERVLPVVAMDTIYSTTTRSVED